MIPRNTNSIQITEEEMIRKYLGRAKQYLSNKPQISDNTRNQFKLYDELKVLELVGQYLCR